MHYITRMTADDAITKAGSVTALARLLGIKRQAVQQFRTKGIPPKRTLQLMELRPEWFKKRKV